MKLVLLISLLLSQCLCGESPRSFITDTVESFLSKDYPSSDQQRSLYRDELSAALFLGLTTRFGSDKSWFVNVYAPVMGWDNHATRSFELIDRHHKKNDMRFNLIVASAQKSEYKHADGAYTEQRMEYARNMCVFRDCGNALELKDFIQGNHGCLHGIHIVKRDADSHVRENMSKEGIIVSKYTPFSDRYDVYAWNTGSSCLEGPATTMTGFLI